MKKVLFLTPNLGTGGGGAERQLANLAVLLKENEFEVEVLCYAEGDFYANTLTDNYIPIIWKVENNPFKRIIKVRRQIRRGNYDAVISFLHTPNLLNNISAIGGKSWKVITGERSAKNSTFISRRGKVLAFFQRYADAIVCNSNNAKEMWKRYYPQYENKLTTIYNIITLPEINTEYIPKRSNKLHIIVAASYQYLKNPIGLIKALSLLSKREREKINIDWYGKNDDKKRSVVFQEASKTIKDNKLEDTIKLYPTTNNIANLYNKADIVALFSRVEGLPNAILEGMMIGKPIIMTRVSDYSTLVDNSNGFLCEWNDIESIKNVLIAASILSEQKLLNMGDKSKEKAKCLFGISNIANQWLSLINK